MTNRSECGITDEQRVFGHQENSHDSKSRGSGEDVSKSRGSEKDESKSCAKRVSFQDDLQAEEQGVTQVERSDEPSDDEGCFDGAKPCNELDGTLCNEMDSVFHGAGGH